MKSLREASETAQGRTLMAVFYDQSCADPAWSQYVHRLGEGIPFVFLADKSDDAIFLSVMAAGGYLALQRSAHWKKW